MEKISEGKAAADNKKVQQLFWQQDRELRSPIRSLTAVHVIGSLHNKPFWDYLPASLLQHPLKLIFWRVKCGNLTILPRTAYYRKTRKCTKNGSQLFLPYSPALI